jgi:hypothetical protein
VEVVRTATAPKFKEDGCDCNWGAAFSPEPARGILTGASRSELESAREPEATDALLGEKTKVTLRDFPEGSVKGVLTGESVNPDPETCSASKLTGSLLVLEICRV